MKKEINEKTFELNITSELLNLSKKWIWDLIPFPLNHLIPRDLFPIIMRHHILFAEGLTQDEESDLDSGGYDVSINYALPNGIEGRLMFLQFKAGIRKGYSTNPDSQFYKETALNEKRDSSHALFTFNDAAKGKQHSILRNLAKRLKPGPGSQAVMYVFPRITDKTDFKNKIGNLIFNSSFVPILDIDNQAYGQTPSILINDGIVHRFRTSYDGAISEVNSSFFSYQYDNSIISKLLAELVCIQIERIANILIERDRVVLNEFLEILSERFPISYSLEINGDLRNFLMEDVGFYIARIKNYHRSNKKIAKAPSNYTKVIPKEGLKFRFEEKVDFSTIKYQAF